MKVHAFPGYLKILINFTNVQKKRGQIPIKNYDFFYWWPQFK